MKSILNLRDISVHYGGVKALDKVDISVSAAEIVAIMGPNGAGKSTILKAVFGLAPISTGTIQWHDTQLSPVVHEMVHTGIVLVPQGRRVFTHLTIEENLEIGALFIKNKHEVARRMEEAFGFFPALDKKRKEKARILSGGEQQMLALARGLMADPKLLMLDEPSLGLAPKVVKEVFEKIKEINERRGTAVMVVEHNLKSLLGIVDRAYVMDKGRVVAQEPSKKLIKSDILERVFMGRYKGHV